MFSKRNIERWTWNHVRSWTQDQRKEKQKFLKGFRILLKIIIKIMRTLVITWSMTWQCESEAWKLRRKPGWWRGWQCCLFRLKIRDIIWEVQIERSICMFLSCHVRVSEWIHIYICLNVKKLPAQNGCNIWSLNDCNGTWTHNHLVCKQTLNHSAKLACFVWPKRPVWFDQCSSF